MLLLTVKKIDMTNGEGTKKKVQTARTKIKIKTRTYRTKDICFL